MLNADRAPYFATCPKCGCGGLEQLRTHAYCVNCDYKNVYDSGELIAIPDWVFEVLKLQKDRSRKQKNSNVIPFEKAKPYSTNDLREKKIGGQK